MLLSTWSPTPQRLRPPPLWLVSSGFHTLGTVSTKKLVRGVAVGAFDRNHWVRDVRAIRWRNVAEVREVRAMRTPVPHRRAVLESLLRLTDDMSEAMRLALDLAMLRTGATAGMVHCFDEPLRAPVTRWVSGMGPVEQIGARLNENDGLTRVARARCVAVGAPHSDRAFEAAAFRLGSDRHEVRGVAMVPIVHPRGLVGMMELARSEHPFRASDAIVLREVAREASPK